MSAESIWERFNEGQMDRRTFVKVASLLGGGAFFGLPLLGCQPAAPKDVFEVKFAESAAMLNNSTLYVGDSRNFFVQEGVKNLETEFAGGADQVRAVLTGDYHMGIVSPSAAMSALEAGQPARCIAGGFHGSGVGFIVRADSPFKKPEDLKGKKIKVAYSRPSSSSHILAYLGLQAIGIDPNDKNQVEFVATGGTPDTWVAIKGGLVDVGWSTEPTISDVELKKEGRLLWMAWDLVKEYAEQGYLTSQSFIDSNPKELKAWITALVKAVEWIRNNQSEAAKVLAQRMGIEAPLAEAALKKFPKEVWNASMPKKNWETTAKISIEFKLLKAMPDWKVLINQSFLPENLRDPSY